MYRNLIIALEDCEEFERAVESLQEWKKDVGSEDFDWRNENDRMRSDPRYREHF